MTNFSDLPTEIWLLIASHTPKSQLFLLKSLNSFFLDCWMDITWKCLMIDAGSPVRAVDLLLRVVDPFVATRVKTLATYLMFHSESPSEKVCKLMSLLLRSLPLLPNITSLTIELLKRSSDFFDPFIQKIASSSLPKGLQKLRIYGHVHFFASLKDYSTHYTPFENLTELDLSLGYRDSISIFGNDLRIPVTQPDLSRSLVPILRFVVPTLRCLHFSDWSGTPDLFDLFNTLNQSDSAPVPNLQSLFISVSVTAVSIPQYSLQSLHRFLVAHSNNLQHLHLTHILPPSHPVVNELLGTWLAKLVDSSIEFPSLQTLQLHPPTSKKGISALVTLIKRTAATLSTLTIPSRYLTGEEINQLLDALTEGQTTPTRQERSSKLKVLEMSITHLSVSLIDLLARRLPQLETLTLDVSEIVDSDLHSFSSLLHQRRYDPNSLSPTQDILHTWKLRYISIRKYGVLQDAVRAVAGAVPSVILWGGVY